MSSDPDKKSPQKFAKTIPFNFASMLSGLIAINIISQNQLMACFFGILGIANFVLSLKFDMYVEKIEKFVAYSGLILSLASLILVLVGLTK